MMKGDWLSPPEAVDLDGDGDLDVLLVNANNDWDNPAAPEPAVAGERRQDAIHDASHCQFTDAQLLTLAVGNLDGDAKPDAG